MTSDDRSFAPPHELAGQIGQLGDAGGGIVPGLAPVPLPGALATPSPGLATAAVAPSPLPHLGPDDPGALTLAIARLANELFAGAAPTSAAPLPTSPATAFTPSNVQLPGSPGISPSVAPFAAPGPEMRGGDPAGAPGTHTARGIDTGASAGRPATAWPAASASPAIASGGMPAHSAAAPVTTSEPSALRSAPPRPPDRAGPRD